MNIRKSCGLFFCLTFILNLMGCAQPEPEGARVTLKLEEISFFVSKPIKHVELTYGERMLIHLDAEDGESLTKLLRGTEKLSVRFYFGDSYYETVKVLGGEDYTTINLPYRTNAKEVLREEGIEIK